jgi:ribosome biogenesis GTPase
VQYFDENTLAIIHGIMPRQSLLKRKAAGKKIEHQLIAANIDIAFVMQSVEFDFNLPRLERYLTMAHDGNIQPVILLSKRDLISSKDLTEMIEAIKSANPGHVVIAFSNKTGEGLEAIHRILEKGKTYCLLGSSGVGKTTLINKLLGEDIFATESVRKKDGKGRHVTARRQMIILEQGGLIIDTPGMRELGNIGIDLGLKETFADILDLARDCRFKNCTHRNEPGCAVKKAVEIGNLSGKRYQNYLKIRKESDFYAMSYLEKRNRDRKFGKLCKDAMKIKKNR